MTRNLERYDPQKAPVPEQWLALTESERNELVLRYHRRARVELPNEKLHAVIHTIVESQVALGDEIPVAEVVQRLQEEGLDRHDAIHAVGLVLANRIFEIGEGRVKGDPNDGYWSDLRELTAEKRLRSG